MMRHLGKVGFLCVLLGGCSLIVGNKLDEKGDAGGLVTDLDPLALAVKGEDPARTSFFVIGERLEIRSANPKWSTARTARIFEGDQASPCPGALEGEVFRCILPSLTAEGTLTVRVVDGSEQKLGEAAIQVRRLLGVGGLNLQEISLFSAEPFERLPPVNLKSTLRQDGATPLLSPSGRFLLLHLTDGLHLVDLVTSRDVKIDLPTRTSSNGTNPHSFEPEFVSVARTTAPQIPIVFHLPEQRLWLVTATGDLVRVEISALLEGNPKATPLGPVTGIRQVLWVVAPDQVDLASAHKVAAAVSEAGKMHFLIRDNLAVEKVTVAPEGQPVGVVPALPVESATSLRRELYFVLQVNTATQTVLTGFNEAKAVLPAVPLSYEYLTKTNPLLVDSLITIPWTGLIGFEIAKYPKTGVVAGVTELLYAVLVASGPKSVELVSRQEAAPLALDEEKPTEILPTSFAKWRLLVRSGSRLTAFPSDGTGLAHNLQVTFPGLLGAVHHPRKEQVFALLPTELRRIDYSANTPELKSVGGLPSLMNGGVLIQP